MRISLKILLFEITLGILLLAQDGQTAAGPGSRQGRKMRLRNYEIQFGTWPLVEITKLSKKPRGSNGPKGPLNGFMKNALQYQTSIPHESIQNSVYQSGRPQGQYSGPFTSTQITQGPTTIMYSSGAPTSSYQTGSFRNGPPPSFDGPQSPSFSSFPGKIEGPIITIPSQSNKFKTIPFSSVMAKAAYSGFFGLNNKRPYLNNVIGNDGFKTGRPSSTSFYSSGRPPSSSFQSNGPLPQIFQSNGPPPQVFQSNGLPPSFQNGPPLPPSSFKNGPLPPPLFHSNGPQSPSSNSLRNNLPPLSPYSFASFLGNKFQSSSSEFKPFVIRGPPPPSSFSSSLRNGKYGSLIPLPLGSIPFPSNNGMMVGDVTNNQRFDMDSVPKVPPKITLGNTPPEGYNVIHGEQQLISLKLPNTKGRMEPEDLLAGADYNGKLRRQDDPFDNPSITTKTMKTREKNLPDVGAIYTLNMVLQTPNISAPTNGSQSESYKQGMEEMYRIYGASNNKQESPLDSQVKLLGKLFTELQHLKPPKVSVETEQVNSNTALNRDQSDGSLWLNTGSLFSKSPLVKPKIDAPIMAVHIQSYSLPEANSQDPDVLDSVRTFGLPGHKFEFGSTNEIINLMDTAQKADASRIPIEELGNNRRQVNENLQQWIKGYINLTRKINHDAHSKGEEIANKSFRQHQVYMPNSYYQSMQPMDPKMFSHAASITNAGAVATYRG